MADDTFKTESTATATSTQTVRCTVEHSPDKSMDELVHSLVTTIMQQLGSGGGGGRVYAFTLNEDCEGEECLKNFHDSVTNKDNIVVGKSFIRDSSSRTTSMAASTLWWHDSWNKLKSVATNKSTATTAAASRGSQLLIASNNKYRPGDDSNCSEDGIMSADTVMALIQSARHLHHLLSLSSKVEHQEDKFNRVTLYGIIEGQTVSCVKYKCSESGTSRWLLVICVNVCCDKTISMDEMVIVDAAIDKMELLLPEI